MSTPVPERRRGSHAEAKAEDAWLIAVAEAASAASGAPVELLGEYLTMLADAAVSGRRPESWRQSASWAAKQPSRVSAPAGR